MTQDEVFRDFNGPEMLNKAVALNVAKSIKEMVMTQNIQAVSSCDYLYNGDSSLSSLEPVIGGNCLGDYLGFKEAFGDQYYLKFSVNDSTIDLIKNHLEPNWSIKTPDRDVMNIVVLDMFMTSTIGLLERSLRSYNKVSLVDSKRLVSNIISHSEFCSHGFEKRDNLDPLDTIGYTRSLENLAKDTSLVMFAYMGNNIATIDDDPDGSAASLAAYFLADAIGDDFQKVTWEVLANILSMCDSYASRNLMSAFISVLPCNVNSASSHETRFLETFNTMLRLMSKVRFTGRRLHPIKESCRVALYDCFSEPKYLNRVCTTLVDSMSSKLASANVWRVYTSLKALSEVPDTDELYVHSISTVAVVLSNYMEMYYDVHLSKSLYMSAIYDNYSSVVKEILSDASVSHKYEGLHRLGLDLVQKQEITLNGGSFLDTKLTAGLDLRDYYVMCDSVGAKAKHFNPNLIMRVCLDSNESFIPLHLSSQLMIALDLFEDKDISFIVSNNGNALIGCAQSKYILGAPDAHYMLVSDEERHETGASGHIGALLSLADGKNNLL